VVDRAFSDPALAALYDVLHASERRGDFAFYLPRVMAAAAVLDVGCGTGALLHRAREAGHAGRLCGLDPADAMLEQARRRADIEWVLGDLASVTWDGEFDLIVMTGHAFQVLCEDDDLRASLAAARSALTAAGRFAFETRNPLAREWEQWTPDKVFETTDTTGVPVRMAHEVDAPVHGGVDAPVHGDIVRFTTTFTSGRWDEPKRSRSTLRFLDPGALSACLSGAGLAIEEQFGDWSGHPLTDASPEIITIARRR